MKGIKNKMISPIKSAKGLSKPSIDGVTLEIGEKEGQLLGELINVDDPCNLIVSVTYGLFLNDSLMENKVVKEKGEEGTYPVEFEVDVEGSYALTATFEYLEGEKDERVDPIPVAVELFEEPVIEKTTLVQDRNILVAGIDEASDPDELITALKFELYLDNELIETKDANDNLEAEFSGCKEGTYNALARYTYVYDGNTYEREAENPSNEVEFTSSELSVEGVDLVLEGNQLVAFLYGVEDPNSELKGIRYTVTKDREIFEKKSTMEITEEEVDGVVRVGAITFDGIEHGDYRVGAEYIFGYVKKDELYNSDPVEVAFETKVEGVEITLFKVGSIKDSNFTYNIKINNTSDQNLGGWSLRLENPECKFINCSRDFVGVIGEYGREIVLTSGSPNNEIINNNTSYTSDRTIPCNAETYFEKNSEAKAYFTSPNFNGGEEGQVKLIYG